ncbi:MAG: type II toxin-antitoxin system RelE/ParE family toxin [Betaproteobacteria bacterium]|nr:type II toxin-antitoxin system RelE/ParE family toxin [Betaproteobacteria bacterium]
MKVRYLPDALRELQEAVAYYHARNPVVARRFADMARMGERLVSEFPEASPKLDESLRVHRVPKFPYSLIYRSDVGEILIVAVAHHSRRPAYWANRLGANH